MIKQICVLAVLGVAAPTFGADEIVTVTTIEDDSDAASGSIKDLPGPDGRVSFREALTVANSMAGPQTIEFAIPADEWQSPEMALLKLEGSTFTLTDSGTTVDFLSQVNLTGDTNPEGCEVGITGMVGNSTGVTAIQINGDSCTIRGLGQVGFRGYGVEIAGDNNRVIGCVISGPLYAGVKVEGPFGGPPAMNNVIGGTAPGEGNILSGGNSGVRVDVLSDSTVVIGNYLTGGYAGIEVRGAPCCPGLEAVNTRIGGPTPEERNVIVNAGYLGEHQSAVGAQVQIEHTPNTIVEGNWIGFEADGITPGNNRGAVGINVHNAADTIIRNTVISGLAVDAGQFGQNRVGAAISVRSKSDNTVITGNRIGIDPTGQFAIPNVFGIVVSPFSALELPGNLRIGGTSAGEGNEIAFNESTGIVIRSLVEGALITGNSIHNNGDLGIDLIPSSGFFGVTPNDLGDSDDNFNGGNNLQNFPVLLAAERAGNTIVVSGELSSAPESSYSIDVYVSAMCDEAGHGEGERYLGRALVNTDSSGIALFTATLADLEGTGDVLTATAIDAASNTSEFSACIDIITPLVGDVNGNGFVTFDDLVAVINAFGMCPIQGPCPADVNNSGAVNIDDMFMVLNSIN